MRILNLWLFIAFTGISLSLAACEMETGTQEVKTPQVTESDCESYETTIEVGRIPECIEEGYFDENSFRRVKVFGVSPEHLIGSAFIIKSSDSQDRWSNAVVQVNDSETSRTLIQLEDDLLSWVNLSCNYDSFEYVEDYETTDDKAYAIIYLNDCIDLK